MHAGLYVDLIGAPIVGLIAYLWLPELAPLHKLMTRPILVALFALHSPARCGIGLSFATT